MPGSTSARRAVAIGNSGESRMAITTPATTPTTEARIAGRAVARASGDRAMPSARASTPVDSLRATWREITCPRAMSPATNATSANTANPTAMASNDRRSGSNRTSVIEV